MDDAEEIVASVESKGVINLIREVLSRIMRMTNKEKEMLNLSIGKKGIVGVFY